MALLVWLNVAKWARYVVNRMKGLMNMSASQPAPTTTFHPELS